MIRPWGAGAGFVSPPMPVASSRLIKAVAASLMLGALSLCVILVIATLSIQTSVALPA